jgi:hypothetical protein
MCLTKQTTATTHGAHWPAAHLARTSCICLSGTWSRVGSTSLNKLTDDGGSSRELRASVLTKPPAHKLGCAVSLSPLNLASVHQREGLRERERLPESVVTDRAGHRPHAVHRARCRIGALCATRRFRSSPWIVWVAIAGLVHDQGTLNSSPPLQIRGSSWADQDTAKITVNTRSPSSPPSQFHFAPEIRSGRVPLSVVGVPAMAGRRGTQHGRRGLAEEKKTRGRG